MVLTQGHAGGVKRVTSRASPFMLLRLYSPVDLCFVCCAQGAISFFPCASALHESSFQEANENYDKLSQDHHTKDPRAAVASAAGRAAHNATACYRVRLRNIQQWRGICDCGRARPLFRLQR